MALATSSSCASSTSPLPPNWTVRMSKSKRKVFYFNTITNETTWQRPTADPNDQHDSKQQVLAVQTSNPRVKRARSSDVLEEKQAATRPSPTPTSSLPLSSSCCVASTVPTPTTTSASNLSRWIKQSIVVGTAGTIETPWKHQVKAVENLICDLSSQQPTAQNTSDADAGGGDGNGSGSGSGSGSGGIDQHNTYLLQHSTGSGKTTTIAALICQLVQLQLQGPSREWISASLRTPQEPQEPQIRLAGSPVLPVESTRVARFRTILLVVDRIKLHEQVGSFVQSFLVRNGISQVFAAQSVDHLMHLMTQSAQLSRCSDPRTKHARPSRPNHQRLASLPHNTQTSQVIISTIQKLETLLSNKILMTRMQHSLTLQKRTDGATPEDELGPKQEIVVIVDEAHRSHSSSTRQNLEQLLDQAMQIGMFSTFIGFTATPTHQTLELFGTTKPDQKSTSTASQTLALGNSRVPFDCYAISDAVREQKIVNVLQNYKSVRLADTTFALASGQDMGNYDDEEDENRLNQSRTMKCVLIMKDFLQFRQQNQQAKCMVVAPSRQEVVRYHEWFSGFLRERNLFLRVFGALSAGNLPNSVVKSMQQTQISEKTLNNPGVTLAQADIVIVCDKLDTGYNDPRLCCMYIDRPLRSSARIVQLLGRLNRPSPGKATTRVMDFCNHPAQIRLAFAEYWHAKCLVKCPQCGPTRSTNSSPWSAGDHFESVMQLLTGALVVYEILPELATDWQRVTSRQGNGWWDLIQAEQQQQQDAVCHLQLLWALDMMETSWHNCVACLPRLTTWFPAQLMQKLGHLRKKLRTEVESNHQRDRRTYRKELQQVTTVFEGEIVPSSLITRSQWLLETISISGDERGPTTPLLPAVASAQDPLDQLQWLLLMLQTNQGDKSSWWDLETAKSMQTMPSTRIRELILRLTRDHPIES